MFYVYNNINNLNNKKKSNEYREAIKVLVKDIKNTDFEVLINTNVYLKSEVCSEIDKLVLNIYSSKDINYKSIEKNLINLYKKFGLMNMIKLYVVSTNQILDSYLFNKCVDHSKRVTILDNTELYYKSCGLISNITMFSIILANDLLSSKIEYVAKGETDYKFIKNLKKEKISLAKGLYNIPVLLSSKETEFVRAINDEMIFKDYMNTYTVLLFQTFSELLFFKEEYNKYFEFNYEYSTTRIDRRRIFSIDHNVVKLRKVLPPKNGIVLKVKNDDNIEAIYFNEKEDVETRAICGVVKYKDGTEEDFVFLLNNFVSASIYCSYAEKVFMALLLFYQVEYDNFYKVLNKYGKMDFEVLSPYYWKYRNSNYETKKEKELRLEGKKFKREYTVNISTFIRKIKGNASKEAQELAERLCVKLEPNHTIVREHSRTYNKNNTNQSVKVEDLIEFFKNIQ